MKKKSAFKRMISSVLVIAMVVSMVPAALAATTEVPGDRVLTKATEYTLVGGLTETVITTNNTSGNDQRIGYLLDTGNANFNGDEGSTIKIVACYKDASYDEMGFQTVTDQAAAYEKTHPGETVIAGINASFFNMTTGEPTGLFVMDGEVCNDATSRPYFAILNDGTAVIREAGTDASDVYQAVAGDNIIVTNGENTAGTGDYSVTKYSRTAIGIKADGTVVTYVTHGMSSPTSCGETCSDLADLLIAQGCVMALNLDGGGSATYASLREGTDKLTVQNSPSDGTPRTVSSTLLVVSTAAPTGTFDHASVTPNNEFYTPSLSDAATTVQFEAAGVDAAGVACDLPDGLTWALTSESSAMGNIDAATGLFTAAEGATGTVGVELHSGSTVVGSTEIQIVEPDEVYFTNEAVSLDFSENSDLGLVVKGQNIDLISKDGDFTWSVAPENIGTVANNIFTSAEKTNETLNGTVTVSYTRSDGEILTDSISVEIGKLPVVVMDFEDSERDDIVGLYDWGLGSSYFVDGTQSVYEFQNYNYLFYLRSSTLSGDSQWIDEIYFTDCPWDDNGDDTVTVHWNGKDYIGTKTAYYGEYADPEGTFGSSGTRESTDKSSANTWVEFTDEETNIDYYFVVLYEDSQFSGNFNANRSASAILGADGYTMYVWHNSANPSPSAEDPDTMNGVGSGIVDSSTGEVRFGENALKLTYDYTRFTPTSSTKNCNIYYRLTDALVADGSPTGLGMWVYAPEGMPNYWFWTEVSYYNGSSWTSADIHFTASGAEKSLQYSGINWTGWTYVEADLSEIYAAGAVVDDEHPIQIRSGSPLILMTYIPGGSSDGEGNVVVMGSPTSGYFYIDNVRWVYGTNVDDLDNPEIISVTANETALSSTESVTLGDSKLTFEISYLDPQGDNYSGIDPDGTQLYLDGSLLTSEQYAADSDRAQTVPITLTNGEHSLTVSISDNFGNKTEQTYYFTVADASSKLPAISIVRDDKAELGGDYTIKVSGENLSQVNSISMSITYGNTDKLETETAYFNTNNFYDDYGNQLTQGSDGNYYLGDEYFEVPVRPGTTDYYAIPSAVLTLGRGVDQVGNIRALSDGNGSRTFTATMTVASGITGTELGTLTLPIPHTLAETDDVPYSVTVTFTMNDGASYTVSTGSQKAELWAYYSIEAGVQIAGAESSDLFISTYDGSAVPNDLKVYSDADSEIAGSFNEGTFTTDWFVSQIAGTTFSNVWVGDDSSRHYSFYSTVHVASAAENDGQIHYDVMLNATTGDSSTTERITWLSTPESTGDAVVQYMKASDYENATGTVDEIFAEAAETAGTAELTQFNIDKVAAYINNVTITGLEAGTTYYCRAGDGTNWSDIVTFKTHSGSDVSFVVVGDTQLSGNDEKDAEDIETLLSIGTAVSGSVDFGIQTGDYVDGGTEYGEWEQISRIWGEAFAGIDFIHVQGNHETYGEEGSAISAAMFGLDDSESMYYSVEYGDVYVAVINQSANLNDAAAWLVEDAAKTDCTWKILTCHQPIYYTNPNGSSEGHHNVLAPACDEAGIDVVFSGHDHSYARTEMQCDGTAVGLTMGSDQDGINAYLDEDGNIAVSKGSGTVYFICGDLGEKSRSSAYSIVENENFNFAETSQDYDALYLTVSADENKLTVMAWNMLESGEPELLDSFSIYTGTGVCAETGEHVYPEDETQYNPATGNLLCSRCGEEIDPNELNYTGFAVDVNGADDYGDSQYYFLAGTLRTGFFSYGEEFLYANDNGLIDHLTENYSTETCTENGNHMAYSPRYDVTYKGGTARFTGHVYEMQEDGTPICSVCGHAAIDIADWNFSLTYSSMTYTGSARTPGVIIENPETGERLTFHTDGMGQITDYRRIYSNNTNVGEATVVVSANPYGDYYNSSGDVTLHFSIRPDLATNLTAEVSEELGIVKLAWTAAKAADSYIVYYSENGGDSWSRAGTTEDTCYTVTGLNQETEYSFRVRSQAVVDGITYTSISYTDPVTAATPVGYDLSDYSLQLSYSSMTYTGEGRRPGTTVTDYNGTVLVNGTDYTVTYSDNVNVGMASVTVCGKGNYYGIITEAFQICPDLPTNLTAVKDEKLGTVNLTWTAAEAADTYLIYYSTDGNTWTKAGETNDVYYTVSGLDQDTEYIFRVRSQATVDGATYMSIHYTDPVSETLPDHPDEQPNLDDMPFTDVYPEDFYYDAVIWAADLGITVGTSEEEAVFSPKEACTRAQIVTFLWRYDGEPDPVTTESPFTDVADSSLYYYKAVLWAAENDITLGTGEDQFSPDQTCDRSQIVTFLYRYDHII